MTATIPERVAKGAALLDEKLPGWVDRIDLDRLNVQSGCDCILGQEFSGSATEDAPGFVIGLFGLFGGELTEAMLHGFTIGGGYDTFPALTREWRRVILARRGQADPVRRDTTRITDTLGEMAGRDLTDDEHALIAQAVTECQSGAQ